MLENVIFFFCRKDSPDWQTRTRRVHVVPIVHAQSYIYVIYTYDGKNVAEYIRLGDGPVNVRDHDIVCVMPQVDVTPATGESQQRFMAFHGTNDSAIGKASCLNLGLV